MMRVVLGLCVLSCLAIVGVGVQLALEQQRHVTSLSVRTTATVLEKRLQLHVHASTRDFSYEPVIKFQFQAQGRRVISDNVFPYDFRVGGNLGRIFANAPLDKFEVGQKNQSVLPSRPPRTSVFDPAPLVPSLSRDTSACDGC